MRSRADTRIVEPLDFEEAVTWTQTLENETTSDDDDDLDWYLDPDPELTQSLRAIKSGRGPAIAMLLAAVAVLATALVVF